MEDKTEDQFPPKVDAVTTDISQIKIGTNSSPSNDAKPMEMIEQTVVIALDNSEYAEHAINWYIIRLHRPGNKLVFIHSIELPKVIEESVSAGGAVRYKVEENGGGKDRGPLSASSSFAGLHMSPEILAKMWKEEEKKSKMLEERVNETLKEKGITNSVFRTAAGKPGEVICRVADEEHAAMIVVGTRGMGKVRRTILGSVSDFVVHHAACPVVVCRSRSRRHSVEGGRSRHASGDSLRAFFGIGERSRNPSGKENKEGVRSRHSSGDSLKAFFIRKPKSDSYDLVADEEKE